MNLWLFAHDYVGEHVFDYIAANFADDISLVITMPGSDISTKSQRMGFATVEYGTFLQEREAKYGARPDIALLAWWPSIIRDDLLLVPQKGFLNIHPSYLPYNRGKNYNFWAIVENAPFGVTIHKAVQKVDSGPILAQRLIPYDWTDTGESLFYKARTEAIALFTESYPTIRTLKWADVPQNLNEGSFHYGKELDLMSHIILDESYTARELLNLLRARTFTGYPACFFEDQGETYEVRVHIERKIR